MKLSSVFNREDKGSSRGCIIKSYGKDAYFYERRGCDLPIIVRGIEVTYKEHTLDFIWALEIINWLSKEDNLIL